MRKAFSEAIKVHQGETLPLGSVVAHPSDHTAYELIGYEGDTAILSQNGITKRFPASEIFDCDRVKNTAIRIRIERAVGSTRFN